MEVLVTSMAINTEPFIWIGSIPRSTRDDNLSRLFGNLDQPLATPQAKVVDAQRVSFSQSCYAQQTSVPAPHGLNQNWNTSPWWESQENKTLWKEPRGKANVFLQGTVFSVANLSWVTDADAIRGLRRGQVAQ